MENTYKFCYTYEENDLVIRKVNLNLPTILVIAVALAMDAFVVSIVTGMQLGCVTGRQTARLAFHFGGLNPLKARPGPADLEPAPVP